MRLNILAFATGVILLQLLPELPLVWQWAACLAVGLLSSFVAVVRRYRYERVIGLLAFFLIGFGWSAMRADFRLADHLAAEWEGRAV